LTKRNNVNYSKSNGVRLSSNSTSSNSNSEKFAKDNIFYLHELNMDYEGKPFGPMPYLLAIAEFVTKLHAICTKSGMLASYSQRVIDSDSQVLVGEYDAYEPRARHCFTRGIDKRTKKL